jgi:hypothetical protein
MANQAVWFEIPVKDLERAMTFYGKAFGWAYERQELGPMKMAMLQGDMNAYGACGALVHAPGYEPAQNGAVVYVACEDVAAQSERIEKAGGTIVVPRTDIGQWGFFAHFRDTEGNRIGIHAMK